MKMVFRAALLPEQKALVLLLKQETNYSHRQIATAAKVSKSSVCDIIQKSKGIRKKVPQKKRRGHPNLLTERGLRAMKYFVGRLRENDAHFTGRYLIQESGI